MELETNGKEPLQVDTMIMIMVEQMAAVAWQKMGLQPDPITGIVEPDLSQAKTAIDVVSDLCKFIEPQLDAEDLREVQILKSNLRVNYVQKSGDVKPL